MLRGLAGGDTVLFTSSAALIVAGKAGTLTDGVAIAAKSIDSGSARAALDRMAAISQETIVEDEETGADD